MKEYDGSENKGVAGYEFNKDSIILKFKDGRTYLYTVEKPGKVYVDEMKKLAVSGHGLTTYVNQNIRGNYAARLK